MWSLGVCLVESIAFFKYRASSAWRHSRHARIIAGASNGKPSGLSASARLGQMNEGIHLPLGSLGSRTIQ